MLEEHPTRKAYVKREISTIGFVRTNRNLANGFTKPEMQGSLLGLLMKGKITNYEINGSSEHRRGVHEMEKRFKLGRRKEDKRQRRRYIKHSIYQEEFKEVE